MSDNSLNDGEYDYDSSENTIFDGLSDDEVTFHLPENDVHVEWGGITIQNTSTGESVYMGEKEAIGLYEILRNVFLIKGVE